MESFLYVTHFILAQKLSFMYCTLLGNITIYDDWNAPKANNNIGAEFP